MDYPMGLRDYVKIYKDFMTAQECEEMVSELRDATWELHQYYNPDRGLESFEKELSVTLLRSEKALEIQNRVWLVLNQYIRDDFKFMAEWFGSWQGYSPIRFNRYKVGTQMKKHCDHIWSMFDGERKGIPTLSILGALNNDYEGGELIFWDGEKFELKAGSIMVFPSNFMYPHWVSEVTKGERYSYVSWAW